MLADLGFETAALDGSAAGLAELARKAEARGLTIDAREGLMTELPFADGAFDFVLSFNVIYHGAPDIVGGAIAEIRRVLKPGGLYQGTMLSKRNVNCGQGEEVAPGHLGARRRRRQEPSAFLLRRRRPDAAVPGLRALDSRRPRA